MEVNLRSALLGSLKISLVVGTLLSLINQYDLIFSGQYSSHLVIKVMMNYLIPFTVASYSKYQMIKYHKKQRETID